MATCKTSEVFCAASPPPNTCDGESNNLAAAASGAGASEYVVAPRVSERWDSDLSVGTKELYNNSA